MIPMKTTTDELIKARDSYMLCHPKYNDGVLHDEESLITHGDISMLSTPIECGKRALITSKYVAAAISDKDVTIIDPNGNMYPDVSKCINEFLSSENTGIKLDVYKWTINGEYAVGPDKIAISANGIPSDAVKAECALESRDANAKLVKFYVDNVMDSVYNVHGKSDTLSLWDMFLAPHKQHDKIDSGFSISFEGDNKQKTLESLLFHIDIISALGQQAGMSEARINTSNSSTKIKQSTAKRLLSMYISSKMGVPYIPMTLSQLEKEVKK